MDTAEATAAAVDPNATAPTAPIDGQPPGEEEKKDGEGSDEDDKAKPMYERYEWLDPRKHCAMCTLKISLISPPGWVQNSKCNQNLTATLQPSKSDTGLTRVCLKLSRISSSTTAAL